MLAAALAAGAVQAGKAGPKDAVRAKEREEVFYPNDEFRQLDTFEGHSLAKADKAFNEGNFRAAAAEYDSFVREFPRSRAVAYAVLRKARCLQLDDKRFEAIKQYQEVLDYFPNAVKYAAAALYYQGLCHWENGDEPKAMKPWAEMARDADYSKQPLAAWAINRLADNLIEQQLPEKAAEYHQQVAVDFRSASPNAARYAIGRTVRFLVKVKPDEPRLRAFYEKVGGFDNDRRRVEADPAADRAYWDAVRDLVKRSAKEFTPEQTELRSRFYEYWIGVMDRKFPDYDDWQIDLAALRLALDGDAARWIERLDGQFEKYQKDGDFGRVVRWIRLFSAHRAKVAQYYNKLDFSKMTNGQTIELMHALFASAAEAGMGRNVFLKVRLHEMSDAELAGLAKSLWTREEEMVRRVCGAIRDKDFGRFELLSYYAQIKDLKSALPLADELAKSPKYAADALWIKGNLLYENKMYAEAIQAYRQVDRAPASLWQIASCYARMGKVSQAVEELRQVENFFADHRAEAAIRIAYVYRDAKMKDEYIAALRAVNTKYPRSSQSSAAHNLLESLGITRIRGGVSEKEPIR